MAFHTLKFGETCARHPPMRDRGADTRVHLTERPSVPPLRIPPPVPNAGAFTTVGVPPVAPVSLAAKRAAKHADPVGKIGQEQPGAPRPASSATSSVPATPTAVLATSQSRRHPAASAAASGAAVRVASGAAQVAANIARPASSASSGSRQAPQPSSGGGGGASGPSDVPAHQQQQQRKQAPTGKPVDTPSDIESDKVFARVDFNGNGMLSLAELDKAVLELWPSFNNKPAIMRAYKAADGNGTGFVSRKEFRVFLKYLALFNNLFLKFQRADANGDRRLTRSEFRDAAGSIEELRGIDADAVFSELDKNGGGILLFDEFCRWFVDESILNPKKIASLSRGAKKKGPKPPPKRISVPITSSVADAFNRVDFNGNGMLSLAELDKAVVELWPSFNNKPAIMRAYKAADRNGSGFVSRKEFRVFLRYLVAYTNLFNAFEAIDASGDRRLTEEEFVDNCGAVEELASLTPDQRRATFRKLDANGGGVVLFDEFAAALADAEIRKTAEAADVNAQNSSDPVVTCLYCTRRRRVSHMRSCRDDVEAAVRKLPHPLRRDVPPVPEIPLGQGPRFDKWSPGAHKALLQIFECPECPKHFEVAQAAAFAEHFKRHNVAPVRAARIRKLDRANSAALTFRAEDPAATAAPAPSAAYVSSLTLEELVHLDSAFGKHGMAKAALTVRALSELLPKMPPAQLKHLASQPSWDDAWASIAPPPPQELLMATARQALKVAMVRETAPNRVPGLFDFGVLPDAGGAHALFRSGLSARHNERSMMRFIALTYTHFNCDATRFKRFIRCE